MARRKLFKLDRDYQIEYIDFLEKGDQWYCIVTHTEKGYVGETVICKTKPEAKESVKSIVAYDKMAGKETAPNGEEYDF